MLTWKGGRGLAVGCLFVIACAHATAPPAVMPTDGAPGREEDRLELGNRYSTSGPQRSGYYRGGRRVSLDEFLRVAGHADIADQMESRRHWKRGLVIGGAAVLAGAIGYGLSAPSCDRADFGSDEQYDACAAEANDAHWISLGAGLTGVAAVLAGFELSARQPSEDELTSWAAAHNRAYRVPPRAMRSTASSLRIAPTVEPGGAGLIMSGRF